MSDDLAILIPVLGRPGRVGPLLESIGATTPEAAVLFLCDSDDEAEIEAVTREGADLIAMTGNYAQKIGLGVRETLQPLIFLGADDLEFKPGWFEAARASLTDGVQVVGVNDLLLRSREHATHFLMTRAYAEQPTVDGKPGPLFQGYSHWFCDDELIATATKRGAYAYCPDAVVEHLHPMAGTAPDDATYERGRAKRWTDAQLFKRRRKLWR